MRRARPTSSIIALGVAVLVVACSPETTVRTTTPSAAVAEGPTTTDTGEGVEAEENHSAAGEEAEIERLAKAREAAFETERANDSIGRLGPAAPIPNPGWTTEKVWNARQNDWEPAIAADPSSEFVYALTTRFSGPRRCGACPRPSIVLRVSADGGATWEPDRFLCVCRRTHRTQYDPQIVTDVAGTVYVAWLEGFRPGVTFVKSTDHGRTWSKPIAVPSAWSDKPWLAVSPDGGSVFIAYNGPTAGDSFVAVSHDGGDSFVVRRVTDDNRYFFAGGSWVSLDAQRIVFAESDFDQTYSSGNHIDAIVSEDGGTSWRLVRVASGDRQPRCTTAGCPEGFYGPTPALAGDASGNLVLAFASNVADRAPQRLYALRSDDGGLTWSDPVALSPAGVPALFPAVAGSGEGDFRTWWMDKRTGMWNVWYSSSVDGGLTWTSDARLSNARGGPAYKRPRGFPEAYGDYGEIAITGAGKTVAIWGEGASYNGPGGAWFVRQR